MTRISAVLALAFACEASHAALASTALRTQAIEHEQRDEWLSAANLWQQLLTREPANDEAFRQRVLALSRAGAPYLAQRLATQRKELFSRDQHYQLAHAAAALTVGFGQARQVSQTGPERFATTDLALQEQAQIGAEFGPRTPTRFDRLLALRERERMPEVIASYESLLQEQLPIPFYVRVAAADAYLALHRPEQARDLLLQALRDAGPGDPLLDAQLTLTYAYLDAEQAPQAIALIDQLLAATPPLSNRGLAGIERANPDYGRIALQAALLRLYADRPDEAEIRLQALRSRAPLNTDLRLAWASLQTTRDHRQAALDELRLLRVDRPESVDVASSLGEALLAAHATQQASALLATLQESAPEQRSVRRFATKLALRTAPIVRTDLTVGQGGNAAGAESVFDASWTSMPLATEADVRMFGHLSRTQGTVMTATANGNERQATARSRLGAGLAYRTAALTLDAEINHASGTASANGIVLTLASALSDTWHFSAALDSNLNTLAAAAYRVGITARQQQVGLIRSTNESQKFGIDLAAINYSDSNQRRAMRTWWNQRWISDSTFRLDTTLSLALGHNRSLPAPYFNPARDQEITLATKAEWLGWRRYQRSFRHRLMLQGGQYRQAGFGPAAAADGRYEQEWQLDQQLALSYGAGHGFHPYDGVREQRSYGYFNLNWILR